MSGLSDGDTKVNSGSFAYFLKVWLELPQVHSIFLEVDLLQLLWAGKKSSWRKIVENDPALQITRVQFRDLTTEIAEQWGKLPRSSRDRLASKVLNRSAENFWNQIQLRCALWEWLLDNWQSWASVARKRSWRVLQGAAAVEIMLENFRIIFQHFGDDSQGSNCARKRHNSTESAS